MTTAAERAVDDNRAGFERERFEAFVEQDWDMDGQDWAFKCWRMS